MQKARFSEQQIIEILKLAEAGTKVADLCRKHGISQWTFYQWRNKYGGMGVSEAKRLKELEEENRRLKKIVADQALDLSALKEAQWMTGPVNAWRSRSVAVSPVATSLPFWRRLQCDADIPHPLSLTTVRSSAAESLTNGRIDLASSCNSSVLGSQSRMLSLKVSTASVVTNA